MNKASLLTLSLLVGCAPLPSKTMAPFTSLTRRPKCDAAEPVCALLTGEPTFVSTPTAEVAYQVFGAGEPLVLIHGWPLNRYTWRRMLPTLAAHYRVYVFDVPGAGDTRWTEETDFTWPGQAKTMKAAIDAIGLEHYFLFAQDSGGVIARELALIDGARVTKLAMTNTEIPNHRPPQSLVDTQAKMSMWPWLLGMVLRGKLGDTAFLQTADGFGDSFSDPKYVLGDFRDYVLAPVVADPVRTEGHRRFLKGWSWEELDSLAKRHAALEMPVLLVWGEDDPTFPVDQAEEMAKQFPHCAGVVRIPKAKLLVHEERPDEVAAPLLEFFR